MMTKISTALCGFAKNLASKASSKVTVSLGFFATIYTALVVLATGKAKSVLAGTKAEAYVDTGVKVLIAVVLGALLLGLLYALFNDTIMPTVQEKVEGLFNYAG